MRIFVGVINKSEITIRDATEADLPEIENLISELIVSIEDQENIAREAALTNFKFMLLDENSHALVADLNDEVIGLINFTTRQTILHSGQSGLIDELVVSKNYRTIGVGTKLVNSAAEKCRSFGCIELEVSTESTNQGAQDFYKRLGFKEQGLIFELDLI